MFTIKFYESAGKPIVEDWINGLRDVHAANAIAKRLLRVRLGNLGDHRPCRDGVSELRFDLGPGYRIYYGRWKNDVILLVQGGDKSTQARDINQAVANWQEWQAAQRLKDKDKETHAKGKTL